MSLDAGRETVDYAKTIRDDRDVGFETLDIRTIDLFFDVLGLRRSCRLSLGGVLEGLLGKSIFR